MKTNQINQIAVIYADNPAEFQDQFNKQMQTLADCNPQVEFNHAKGYCAYITYTQNLYEVNSVADEYRADGIYFTCAECPLHEMETDGRKKRVQCKYAKVGFTKLSDNACEVFYRRLMLGDIKAKGEPHEVKETHSDDYWQRREHFSQVG